MQSGGAWTVIIKPGLLLRLRTRKLPGEYYLQPIGEMHTLPSFTGLPGTSWEIPPPCWIITAHRYGDPYSLNECLTVLKILPVDDVEEYFLLYRGQDFIQIFCYRSYTTYVRSGSELFYARVTHGFDSGIGRGIGVASRQDRFLNWLRDL